MYQSRVMGQGLFEACSQGYGQAIETFGETARGETPMSLVNIALASCVTMCVQGYFAKRHDHQANAVLVDATYDEAVGFDLCISLPEGLPAFEVAELEAYILTNCRVKALLRPDLDVRFRIG